MTKRRNPLGRAAILGKGGVHLQSRSGGRHAAKRAMRRGIDEWLALSADDAPAGTVRAQPRRAEKPSGDFLILVCGPDTRLDNRSGRPG